MSYLRLVKHSRKFQLSCLFSMTLTFVLFVSTHRPWHSFPFNYQGNDPYIFKVLIEGGQDFRVLCRKNWKDDCHTIAKLFPSIEMPSDTESLNNLEAKLRFYLSKKGFSKFQIGLFPVVDPQEEDN